MVSLQDLVILGAGGLAREVAFLISEINQASARFNFLGFVEKDDERIGTSVGDSSVYCSERRLQELSTAAAIGIGDPKIIKKITASLSLLPNIQFPNLIHPKTVHDDSRITLGRGNIVTAGNVFTTDISVGSFNFFNLSCTVGHDSVIGDCNVINPGVNISGNVTIHDGCLIGTGAAILQGITIGEGAIVGAGSVVTKDVASGVTVVGVPAKAR